MMQMGFFDWQNRLKKIDKNGDPLEKINQVVDWDMFRPSLQRLREKERKSNAGAKPYDVVQMFKILILQSLYNLSDEATELQVLDRLTFMRFVGLKPGEPVPDEKTNWLFRETLSEANMLEVLFQQFDEVLVRNGFAARTGQIIDASIVSVPKQRNSREESSQIKEGRTPEQWDEAKKRQKDVDARWTKKNGKTYYGYKNHVAVDVKHKLIRGYQVTDAAVHDSQVVAALLDENNTRRAVYADSAYRSEQAIQKLQERRFREHIQRKGCKNRKLTKPELQGNRSRAKIRSGIEHVFGVQAMIAGGLVLRGIGIIRARIKIGLRNLAYNINRYSLVATTG